MASGEEGNPPSDPTASAGTSGSAPIVDHARGRPPTAATAPVSTWGASRLEARQAITPWKSAATGTTAAAAQTWARLGQVPGTGEAVRAHARKSEGQADRELLAKLGQVAQRMTAHQNEHLRASGVPAGGPSARGSTNTSGQPQHSRLRASPFSQKAGQSSTIAPWKSAATGTNVTAAQAGYLNTGGSDHDRPRWHRAVR